MSSLSPKIKPFKISVHDAALSTLHQQLSLTTLPTSLSDMTWDTGPPLTEISFLLTYWKGAYDWRAAEVKLNQLPQFTVPIDVDGFGQIEMHCVHAKSKRKNAVPLVSVHGWPGSFWEGTKLIPELTEAKEEGEVVFDVVLPSLIGFGFSEGVKKGGFGMHQQAEACHKLMLALGYDQYVTQGGDIGHAVTRLMGYHYPKHCKSSHTNVAMPVPPPGKTAADGDALITEAERKRNAWFWNTGRAYWDLHNTRPQTIGYLLSTSPVGLLAWLYEKIHDWSDPTLFSKTFPPDTILTCVSIYLFSRAGPASAQRIYHESARNAEELAERMNIVGGFIPGVKLGIARFPYELAFRPREWEKGMGEVVLQSEYESGGHFSAWERPDAVVRDLREMMGKGGGAEGAVKGRRGF